MTQQDQFLAIALIERSTAYKAEQIEYTEKDGNIVVFCDNENETFGGSAMEDIIPLFNCFFRYNPTEKRVELIIY